LREFERLGLVRAAGGGGTDPAFDFRDLLSLRALVSLLERGVPMRRIQRSVKRVRERRNRPLQVGPALALEDGAPKRLVLRDHGSRLDPDGQLLLNFAGDVSPAAAVMLLPAGERRPPRTALEWFERGCELDADAGTLTEAIVAYRRAVELDPALADGHCNLGTAHYNRGERDLARESYQAALVQDPRHREANFNLANLLEEAGRREAAVHHYKRAVDADPCFADAHLNLALLYEKLAMSKRGREHWRRYLQLAPEGSWAEVARQRLRRESDPRPS